MSRADRVTPRRDDALLIALLARVARRDAEALRLLYDQTAPKLLGLILRIRRDRSAAEDILQDVYLRVWQAAASYAPEAGAPLPWLYAIARHRTIDAIRRRGEVAMPGTEDGMDWLERLADPQNEEQGFLDRDALRACLGRLDATHRDCVVLAYCEGYSREELAQRFGRPVNTIKTWLHRSLGALKGCLEAAA